MCGHEIAPGLAPGAKMVCGIIFYALSSVSARLLDVFASCFPNALLYTSCCISAIGAPCKKLIASWPYRTAGARNG